MPLPYTLHKNSIRHGGDKVTYRAVPKHVQYVNIEDAIEALTQPGSILKYTECYAVIYRFLDYLSQQLAEGNGFLSPYFRLTPGLKGVFESEQDAYDPKRHRPSVNFRLAKKMQEAMRNMKVQRIETEIPAPEPMILEDWESDVKNQLISPSFVAVVRGEQLKISDPEDTNQGVFFIHVPTQETYRAERIHHNYPTKLLLTVPENLPAGQYRLEVRSAFSNSQEIRSSRLRYLLQVLP